MKNGKVIEVHDADHGDFIRDATFQSPSSANPEKFPAE